MLGLEGVLMMSWTSGSPGVVLGQQPQHPLGTLEAGILGPHPSLAGSDTLGVEPGHLCPHKALQVILMQSRV